jgi:formate dehydrogenase iron-sulfur subunit
MSATSERTLIDQLLEEQRELTAVERFSRAHAQDATRAHEKYYRDLIPLTRPQAGEQYAFQVDLDKCSGCKACVTACHNLNGLAENETWRSVGVLHGGTARDPVHVTVTTACHHCADPACLNGCPVLAYEKDAITGIVHHLDDQCIGCQYCILKCPYDAPQYNKAKGIVRKCDMCASRLSAGEAPACVQSCPNEAIEITIVAAQTPQRFDLVSPLPTTLYKSSRLLSTNLHTSAAPLTPAQSHPPLVPMLVLTQLSVGIFSLAALSTAISASQKAFALAAALLGLIASVFHLGQPQRAWRSFLGWRKSWLSREVLAFGAFFNVAALTTLTHSRPLQILTALTGLAAVFTSVMVYADTHRAFWSLPRTTIRFFGTALLLAFSAANFTTPAAVVLVCKLLWEISTLRRHQSDPSLARSAALLTGALRNWTLARFTFGLLGGAALLINPIAAFTFLLLGELIERHLFFIAVAPPKILAGVST